MDETIAALASTVASKGKEGLTPTAMPNVGLYKVSQCIESQRWRRSWPAIPT